MPKISVVIPSRLQAATEDAAAPWFVERAIQCVLGQSIFTQGFTPEILVGVDPGMGMLAAPRLAARARICEASTRSQAAALNASCRQISGDVVAFLEDDDLWEPRYLERAVQEFSRCQFVSSTHLERTVTGVVVRIVDYPTPSSWVMPRSTFDQVGLFNEEYRWHLDSEWLGRMNELKIPRIHFVEATAPIEGDMIMTTRVNLAAVLRFGGEALSFLRHESPWPLVMRTVHPGSGMAQIAASEAKTAQSKLEYERLGDRFGCVPW